MIIFIGNRLWRSPLESRCPPPADLSLWPVGLVRSVFARDFGFLWFSLVKRLTGFRLTAANPTLGEWHACAR
jgi:hypothetical protein